jgi:hypothetical protein
MCQNFAPCVKQQESPWSHNRIQCGHVDDDSRKTTCSHGLITSSGSPLCPTRNTTARMFFAAGRAPPSCDALAPLPPSALGSGARRGAMTARVASRVRAGVGAGKDVGEVCRRVWACVDGLCEWPQPVAWSAWTTSRACGLRRRRLNSHPLQSGSKEATLASLRMACTSKSMRSPGCDGVCGGEAPLRIRHLLQSCVVT